MRKSVLSLVLALAVLVACLVSCSGGESAESVTQSSAENTPQYEEIDAYTASLAEEYSFDGESFSIIGKTSDHCEFEEETGNLESDALYKRARELEDLFGITYSFV